MDEQRLAQAQQACVNRNASAAAALQAAVQAEPFSMDILRLRLLDAKTLGLSSEAQSAQGEAMYHTHTHTADHAVALASLSYRRCHYAKDMSALSQPTAILANTQSVLLLSIH